MEALKFTEFETKYKVDRDKQDQFKDIMEDEFGIRGDKFLNVQSNDAYFVHPEISDPPFLRFRRSDNKKDKRKELTYKKKRSEANNFNREEVNLRVDASPDDTVVSFVKGLGYQHNIDVYKYCDIYYAEDAVLVFYTVKESNGKRQSFIEIEVNEDLSEKLTEAQNWDIITKWEKAFAPLGISHHNRLRKSLFEMYRK